MPATPAKSGSSPYGDSWAIVVGINRYRKPALRLHYAVNDARSVTAALQKVGFPKRNIITLLDEEATARAIRTAFNTLVGKTQSQDRVFIFVAGHGVTLDRPGGGAMGYLLPVEADPANILGTAMPMSEVKDMASLLKAKHVFFAVDACFSGLLAARSVPRLEKRVDAAYLTRGRLRQVLTAGERDQPVLEEGGHGLFTRRLLEAMEGEADISPRDGVLTAMEVAAFVQGRVIASSSSRQTPFFGTMDGVGQFVFTAPGMGARPPRAVSELARMKAKMGADRRKLEAEKARLEREHLKTERALIEAERRKLREERQRLAKLRRPGEKGAAPERQGLPQGIELEAKIAKARIIYKGAERQSARMDKLSKMNAVSRWEQARSREDLELARIDLLFLERQREVRRSSEGPETADRLAIVVLEGRTARAEVLYKRAQREFKRIAELNQVNLTTSAERSRAERAFKLAEITLASLKKRLGKRLQSAKEKKGGPPQVAVGPGAPQQIGRGLDTMVLVPAGEFLMGSNSGDGDEKPRRRVYLDGFFIDKYPVTNVRFRRYGRPKKDFGSMSNDARQPAAGVSWTQARDYCGSVGKRLPTEAEWEKAARGVDGRKYPWGNQWDGSKAIWSENSGSKANPVDRASNTHRSPYGVADMVGNVWEWVGDWYKAGYYREAPERNPKGPSSGIGRVVRGGSWYDFNPTSFRAANRKKFPPDLKLLDGGFRCAKSP